MQAPEAAAVGQPIVLRTKTLLPGAANVPVTVTNSNGAVAPLLSTAGTGQSRTMDVGESVPAASAGITTADAGVVTVIVGGQ